MSRTDTGGEWTVTHGGRDFTTTAEMGRIFRRQARRIVESGNPELVVLRHSRGVDMVLITDSRSFSIRTSKHQKRADSAPI